MITVTKPTPEELKAAASKMRAGMARLKETLAKHKDLGHVVKPEEEKEAEK